MSEIKSKGLGFAAAMEKQPGQTVVYGGLLRRILEVSKEPTGRPAEWPVFRLEGVDESCGPWWISWLYLADYAGRTVKELAKEALDIQDGCNPLGLSKGYARALQDLRYALTAEGLESGTDVMRYHPINRLWLDKLCDLARYQRSGTDFSEFSEAYDGCRRLAGLDVDDKVCVSIKPGGEVYTCYALDCPVHGERNRQDDEAAIPVAQLDPEDASESPTTVMRDIVKYLKEDELSE